MAVFRLTAVLLTLTFLHVFIVYVCQSCSEPDGWQEPTLVDKILQAESVLYGMVKNKYPDQRHPNAYTTEMEVYCIFKGPTTPLIVNITEAGYIGGMCAASEFDVNRIYIALAVVKGESPLQLRVQHGMVSAKVDATPENLNEIRKACGLNPVTRPEGSSSSIECPVSVPDCQSEPTPKKKLILLPDGDREESASEVRQETRNKPPEPSSAIATAAMTLTTAAAVALVFGVDV